MNMNLKNLIKKMSFVVILLQINFVRCSYASIQAQMQEQNLAITSYARDVIGAAKNKAKDAWYIDFTQRKIKKPCEVLYSTLMTPPIVLGLHYKFTNEEWAKYLELVFSLGQSSKQCWLSLIKEFKKDKTTSPTVSFERMAGSALRTYVYLLIENKVKWQNSVSWWKNPWERVKLLYQGIPGFYLIAVVEELRKIENNPLRILLPRNKQTTPYKDFLRDLPTKVREYLTNIPDELLENLSPEEVKKLQFSEDEIQDVIKNLTSKLNPRHIRRYLKYYLAAGVVVVGVGYILVKNRAEIKGEYQEGGLGGVLQYGWQGLKRIPERMSDSISGYFYNNQPIVENYKEISSEEGLPSAFPLMRYVREYKGWLPKEGMKYVVGIIKNGRFFELKDLQEPIDPNQRITVIEVPEDTPFLWGNLLKK